MFFKQNECIFNVYTVKCLKCCINGWFLQVMLFQNTSAQRDVTHLTFHMHIVIGSSQRNFMSSIPFDLYSSFLR